MKETEIQENAESGVDDFGVKYDDYPACPSGKMVCRGRVGRSAFWISAKKDGRDTMFVNEWYCYGCGSTF